MTIEYINHDVTKTIRGVVAHGCNCQGVMGSGVALAIRKQWPIAYERYQSFVAHHRALAYSDMSSLLGLAQILNVGHPLIDEQNSLFVANMFTQQYYGNDGKKYASPQAVAQALETVLQFCRGSNLPLYIPRIGCGLGGLIWEADVLPNVETLQSQYNVQVYVCDL